MPLCGRERARIGLVGFFGPLALGLGRPRDLSCGYGKLIGTRSSMGPPHTVSLLLLTLVTGLISSSNYSCAAATSAECAASGTCSESAAVEGVPGGAKAAMDARRARMAALAAEINASIEQRQSEERRWDTQRQNAQREERALHEAQKKERKRMLRAFYEAKGKPERVADVDKILDNYPFDQVVQSLLKVYNELPQGWTAEREKQGVVSPELREQTWHELYGGGQNGV